MFLRAARLHTPRTELPSWLADLPVVRSLERQPLEFDTPVTILTGENGTGKSTLVEALAVGLRLNPEGGSRHATVSTVADSVSPLHEHLLLTRPRNPRDAWFLRGESHLNVAAYHESLGPSPIDDLLHMSHGESLMALVERRFHDEGIFLLDEPEAGLSHLRQLELLGRLWHLADAGAQFIMATHSPILLAVPGARILELDESGLQKRTLEETECHRAAVEFMSDPHGTAAFLTGEEP
ncbi:MAG: AAA family ATPase [Corynebacterium humireducens]|jgi:predicted ATPase|uniref:AAA family ATPase n=1 Tax=Corynebacterium humireducens TaxID=1223514 RepID=A0A7X6PNE7_9CORY|nr:AAA family ATPase [Corynebacterium sp.]NLA56153.1 AAA family ATPase [Corynebacterium humireducens]HHU68592.1 AAA family ATPase [Corynebacterium sp.]